MKDKKKLILTIILSLVAVVIFVGASILINNQFKPQNDGQIQVELIDLEGNTTIKKSIDFKEGDTLLSLLEGNFGNVVMDNGMLMSIESFSTSSDWSTFISLYVDNQMSMVGLNDIKFSNGTVISIRMTEYIADYGK